MKKYKLEIILFTVNVIYMILELIASRILSPFFGNSNFVWTSVIGIILLSTSVGNYIGGILADKDNNKENNLKVKINIILLITAILIFIIPLLQNDLLLLISRIIKSIKIGAIIATILLFFTPSMFIGMLSPIIIKLKMNKLESAGKISGKMYALATLGSIVGTFFGGFFLIPTFGSNEILFVLSMVILLLNYLVYDSKKNLINSVCITVFIINIIGFGILTKVNAINGEKVLEGKTGINVNYDTQYGKVTIYNTDTKQGKIRQLNIDRGHESATFLDEDKKNELVYTYTKYYDLMFKSPNNIQNVLMIGGAGYSYPKYYINKYKDKYIDVIEIDKDVTELAKKFFFLEENEKMQIITQDGRTYLNQNTKKYDAILNDSFSGETPAKTLTTLEAVQKIYNSLNKNGLYLTNIISSREGKNSKFIKAEVNTIKQVFKNVYVVPCNNKNEKINTQNNMVIATDGKINLEDCVNISTDNSFILTDNYNPVDTLIPEIDR